MKYVNCIPLEHPLSEELREIELLNGSKIRARFVWCFTDADIGPSYYPQAVRAWPSRLSEKLRQPYLALESTYARRLASMVQTSPTYVFKVPSRYPFAGAYLDACKSAHPKALDISDRFRKSETEVAAGENDTTPQDIYRSLNYQAAGDEKGIKSITMIDDVVARKKNDDRRFYPSRRSRNADQCRCDCCMPFACHEVF